MALGAWNLSRRSTAIFGTWGIVFSAVYCLEEPISKGQKTSAFRRHELYDRLASGSVLR